MNITIVGGGTAAWTAAAFLICHRPQHSYTIIASSRVPTIGVGEAATGMLSGLIQQLGIDKWEFMQRTDALPKLAIDFQNWRGDNTNYLHPIDSSYSSHNLIDHMVYHAVAENLTLSDTSRNAHLAQLGLTNIAWNGTDFEEMGSLTWVVDPNKLAALLQDYCIKERATVIDTVIDQVLTHNGMVTGLVTDLGVLTADVFIDCTGQASVLSSKLDIGWTDYQHYLPVNKAIPFRLESDSQERQSVVTCRAMKNGWMWAAHTRHRIGRGYVFSDQFASAEDVLQELQEHFQQKVYAIKTLDFKSGVCREFFKGNVLTLGMGAGFLEPMQATSIHASLVQINDWANLCLSGSVMDTLDPLVAATYNTRCQGLYQDMMEFVAIHYVTDRTDTDYWKFVHDQLQRPDKVKQIISLASKRLIRNDDFSQYLGSAGAPLWIYSMAGLGLFDQQVCRRVLKEYGHNFDHIQGHKQLLAEDISKHKDKIFTATDLNNFLKNMQEQQDHHPNFVAHV